jgi:DNA-binding transcriptional regulator YdaS (Cro superfamily)
MSHSSLDSPNNLITHHAPIRRAIALVGSQTELARRLGIQPQSVQQWAANGEIPLKRVPAVAEALNHEMSFSELRPDYFV